MCCRADVRGKGEVKRTDDDERRQVMSGQESLVRALSLDLSTRYRGMWLGERQGSPGEQSCRRYWLGPGFHDERSGPSRTRCGTGVGCKRRGDVRGDRCLCASLRGRKRHSAAE